MPTWSHQSHLHRLSTQCTCIKVIPATKCRMVTDIVALAKIQLWNGDTAGIGGNLLLINLGEMLGCGSFEVVFLYNSSLNPSMQISRSSSQACAIKSSRNMQKLSQSRIWRMKMLPSASSHIFRTASWLTWRICTSVTLKWRETVSGKCSMSEELQLFPLN